MQNQPMNVSSSHGKLFVEQKINMQNRIKIKLKLELCIQLCSIELPPGLVDFNSDIIPLWEITKTVPGTSTNLF